MLGVTSNEWTRKPSANNPSRGGRSSKIVFASINADYLQRIEPGRVIRALKALQESPA